jgi:hypothetical protein
MRVPQKGVSRELFIGGRAVRIGESLLPGVSPSRRLQLIGSTSYPFPLPPASTRPPSGFPRDSPSPADSILHSVEDFSVMRDRHTGDSPLTTPQRALRDEEQAHVDSMVVAKDAALSHSPEALRARRKRSEGSSQTGNPRVPITHHGKIFSLIG